MASQDIFKLMAGNFSRIKIAAMNRAAQSTLASIKDRITDKYNIKRKDLSAKMTLIKAASNKDYANISIRHEPVGLIYFGARQTNKGISYAIDKGKRSLWRGAFVADVSTEKSTEQRYQAFERYGPKVRMTKGRYKGKLRQRIRKLSGPSIAQFFIGRKWTSISDFIQNTFVDKFNSEFARLKDVFLSKTPEE